MTTSDAEIARAEALGRLAARDGQSLSANPYPPDRRVERARWARAHAGVTAQHLDDDGDEPDVDATDVERADLDDNRDDREDATRADLNPDDDTFRRYWTEGEGLAKWLGHPHEWTALRDHLIKYVGPERADRIASEWFHRVKGFWPGSDLHRVEHGKPPRGDVVGPG